MLVLWELHWSTAWNSILNRRLLISHVHLVGGGGHALVVAEAAHSSGQRVIGFYDDNTSDSPMHSNSSWLGTFDDLARHPADTPLIIAIGALQLRRILLETHCGDFATVIHSTAIIAVRSHVGADSFVAAGAVISVNANVGNHSIINTRAVVEHDCILATNVHVGPGAVLGGGVQVGSHTLVGLNASIKSNVIIGRSCIIGAGAAVVKDVPDGEVVAGVPARSIRSVFHQRRIA